MASRVICLFFLSILTAVFGGLDLKGGEISHSPVVASLDSVGPGDVTATRTSPSSSAKDCAAPGSITIVESMAHEIIVRCTFAEHGGGARMELDGQTLLESAVGGGTQTILFRELEELTEYRICVWNYCNEERTDQSDDQCRTVSTIQESTCEPPGSWQLTEITDTTFTFNIEVGDFPGVMIGWKNDRLHRIKQMPAGVYSYTMTGGEAGDVYDLWFWEFCNGSKTLISPRATRQVIMGQTQPSSCCEDFSDIERWIAHVPAAAGIYDGTLLFYSLADQNQGVTLCAFASNGALLEETELSFTPMATERHAVSALFASSDVGFIGICGPRSVAASIIYENRSDPTPCVVPEDVSCGRVMQFTAGGLNNWDGFAALNTSETVDATMDITQYSESGSAITTVAFDVPAGAKTVVNLYSQGFSPAERSYFEVRSNTPVCLMALRGLLDRTCGDALFTNPVQVID